MTQQATTTEQPKETLLAQLSKTDPDQVRKIFDVLSMLVRAFDGKDISESDVITRLVNVKDILERSRFPSMSIINFQVYCRLVAKYHPELIAFEDWANIQAHALISYQGLSREEYVEMMKAQLGYAPTPQTAITLGGSPQAQAMREQQKKAHWWSRKPKEQQPSEFRKD